MSAASAASETTSEAAPTRSATPTSDSARTETPRRLRKDFAQASVFYGLTGLHGAHVFIGLTLLLMVNIRAFKGHFSPEEHRGVEVPGIYWHFVDVMWLIVYSTVYIL